MERRKEFGMSQQDRDLLIEIHTEQKNFIKSLDDHKAEDKENFKTLGKKADWHDKIIWMGLGGLALMELALKLFK